MFLFFKFHKDSASVIQNENFHEPLLLFHVMKLHSTSKFKCVFSSLVTVVNV